MKVLYDHQMFSLQKFGGITKYFCELMKNYPPGYEYQLSVLFSNNQHLKDDYKILKKLYLPLSTKRTQIGGIVRSKMYEINQGYSSKIIRQDNFDLFHPTYFDPYFFPTLKKPYILTVHDLITFRFKEIYKNNTQRERIKSLIHHAKRIIAISEHTKNDLMDILDVSSEKIDVIYHGFNKFNLKEEKNLYGRYILFVGARLNYKNFKRLAEAFGPLAISDPDLKLICVGPEFTKVEIEFLERFKIREKTIAVSVNEKDLNILYSHALTYVYPTLYEGFGMPILEAFANDCPVCLSQASCLPEIAGNAGNYFDPNNAQSISDAIQQVIYNPDFSKALVEKGQKRLNNFSWKKCALQTVESYHKALQ